MGTRLIQQLKGRNPSVLIREIPTASYQGEANKCCANKSQSLRADQGNSDSKFAGYVDDLVDVAIPPC